LTLDYIIYDIITTHIGTCVDDDDDDDDDDERRGRQRLCKQTVGMCKMRYVSWSSRFVVVIVIVVDVVVVIDVVYVGGGDAKRSIATGQQGFDAERVQTTGLVRGGRRRRGQVQQRWRR